MLFGVSNSSVGERGCVKCNPDYERNYTTLLLGIDLVKLEIYYWLIKWEEYSFGMKGLAQGLFSMAPAQTLNLFI